MISSLVAPPLSAKVDPPHDQRDDGDHEAEHAPMLSVVRRATVWEHLFPMTAQGHAYTRFKRALRGGNANLALDAAAELQRIDLADALSLLLLIREDRPALYDKAAARWFARYAADDHYFLLRDARDLVDLLDGIGRHDGVAVVRLERWLRARGYDDEADRVA